MIYLLYAGSVVSWVGNNKYSPTKPTSLTDKATSLYCISKENTKAGYFILDGLVKIPIYFVVGFLKLHDILHVWSRNFKKHYASYIKIFSEPSEISEHTFYETVIFPVFDEPMQP